MNAISEHLVIAPIVVPLFAAAALLLFDERARVPRVTISLLSAFGTTAIAIMLLLRADAIPVGPGGAVAQVYPLGNWPAPFGIVLVLDRLSALMLVLTGVLACASLVFSLARWDRAGPYFHALFQLLLMGLNGAFLTGDLFNLFVFFELLLAASYGLLLHGTGLTRVRAGLQYIAVNLAASSLFLIGVSLIYGVTGTLNMADLAQRIPAIPDDNRMLLEAGAAILGIAFLVKAGMWPLGFWLPTAYAAATPPVASVFTIMTKVGIYVVLRLSLLLFGADAGASAHFGATWLLYGGIMTIVFGLIGVLAAQDTSRMIGFALLVSSGTLLAAVGFGARPVVGGALYYLVSSTLAIGAFFLLTELVERGRTAGADMLAVTMEAFGDGAEEVSEEEEEIGTATPATLAVLGLSFLACALLIAGLPPLSGFIAKFSLLTAMLNPANLANAGGSATAVSTWVLLVVIVLSGLATIIALTRAGMRTFWSPIERTVPRVRAIELLPVAALLLFCLTITVQAGPVMRFMQDTARSLELAHDGPRGILPPVERPAPPSTEAQP
ncbi:MAG TPA: monovalent cation/H+ antiporter subunit D [Xanthobacteraceae bacterium]|nr:monovalent cation/H+ antiporter subunit D [Xanthobacteraceae bacterium]